MSQNANMLKKNTDKIDKMKENGTKLAESSTSFLDMARAVNGKPPKNK